MSEKPDNPTPPHKRSSRALRVWKDRVFVLVCVTSAFMSIVLLGVLLSSIVSQAMHRNHHVYDALRTPAPQQFADWQKVDFYGLSRHPRLIDEWAPLGDLSNEDGTPRLDWAKIAAQQSLTDAADISRVDWKAVESDKSLRVNPAQSLRLDEDALAGFDWQRLSDSLGRGTVSAWVDGGAPDVLLSSPPSRNPEQAGIYPAMMGTLFICAVCAVTAIPIGVATAILLNEFKPRHRLLLKAHAIVELNITNLAGVPSVVYGILALTAFVQMFHMMGNANKPTLTIGETVYDEFRNAGGDYVRVYVSNQTMEPTTLRNEMTAYAERIATDDLGNVVRRELEEVTINLVPRDAADPAPGDVAADAQPQGRIVEKDWYYIQLPFGRGVLAGGLTLMLVVLPIIIVSSQEALRAVPDSLRQGSMALGSTKWQTVWNMTLPTAVPGIMTGSILAMSRAIGEAAPILIIAGIVYIIFTPQHLMDEFTAMPLQIYDWAKRPQEPFHDVAAAGIVLLLTILLSFNALAVYIRQKTQKKY